MRVFGVITIAVTLLPGCMIEPGPGVRLSEVGRQPTRRAVSASDVSRANLVRATNPDAAMRWRRLRWQDENGRVPEGALRRALEQREVNLAHRALRGQRDMAGIDPLSWVEHGPNNVGGRTRSLLIHPNDTDRMWAGSVSGGIWHSTDGGASWSPVDDHFPNLAICCMAFDPSNPDIIYAGTGEGFFNLDGIGGAGIYKSSDGGQQWTQLPSTAEWDTVNRIAVSPDNSNVLLAAKRYGGILRSTNGGATWTTPLWAQGCYYVAFDPTDGSKAIAHILDYDWNTNDWFHMAVYSLDAGLTWDISSGGLSRVYGFGMRIELAYAPSDPMIVYASCAERGGKIWRSTDGGQTYELRTDPDSTTGVSWYANPIWVDPTDPDFIVTGGYNLLKSENGGMTFQQISDGYIMTLQPHVDQHLFLADPGFDGVTNTRAYACTDGGVWRTDDVYSASKTSGWTKMDQYYRTTQFYGAAGDGPAGMIIGGTQDNGTLRVLDGSDQAHLTFGGDGGFCAIDPTDSNYCYGEYVNLMIHRSTDGGQTASFIYAGIGDADENANFIAPFILDPNDPSTMLAGGKSLWRSSNVKATTPSWTRIRAAGTANTSAIAVAPGNSAHIWVGQNNGEVHRTQDGTGASPTWTVVDDNVTDDPLPNRYIERILVDPDDENVVYIALGGFSQDNLWKTADGGQTWSDITGDGVDGLPDAPINGLARHPNQPNWLYVGTEVGIFASGDGGQSWSADNEGPASVSVDELVFMHGSNRLLAATHGRGLFTADTGGTGPYDFNGDGLVDDTDFIAFGDCFTGPNGGDIGDECAAGDGDSDGDVDCEDWSQFEIVWSGPGEVPEFTPCLTSVPALGGVGLAITGLLMSVAGIFAMRRRRSLWE